MWNPETHVRINLFFPILQKNYECLFSRDASFTKNLQVFQTILERDAGRFYRLHERVIIVEKESGRFCDLDISLKRLGIQDGMTFILY